MESQEIKIEDPSILADAQTMQILNSQEARKKIIDEMLSVENQERKLRSFKQVEIYEDRMEPFVYEELLSMFKDPKTVKQIPQANFVNILKKVVNKQATLYRCAPKRVVSGLSEEQIEKLKDFYEDSDWNEALGDVNTAFKIQDQATLWVAPIAGKLRPRVLYNHMIDVIPHPEDPAIPLVYMVSPFDRSLTRYSGAGDGANGAIADADDHKLRNWKILVWTKAANFVMNGKGEIVSKVLPNPIGELPFIDVSRRKNLNFFLDSGKAMMDFTVKFNAALSDSWYVVKMQGWAIGWFKGPANMVPESVDIGPGRFIHLPKNEQTGDSLELGFTNPNADIEGTLRFLETMVSLFLSSQGIDPKEVAMRLEGRSFSSGLERLLAMLEVFEATEGDMKIMAKAERRLFDLLRRWTQVLSPTNTEGIFPPELRAAGEKAQVKVEYKKPEMVQTESEKIDLVSKKEKAGYISRKMALKNIHNLDDEGAEEMLETILRDEAELKELGKTVNDEFGITPEPEGGANPPDNKDVKDEKTEPRQD